MGRFITCSKCCRKGAEIREVYLPDTGDKNIRFYDYYTRNEYEGGQTIKVPVDISSIPMFIKSGAIIPMAGNELNNLMNDKVDSLHIIMAPDIDSSFTIYDDDGKLMIIRMAAT